MISISDAQLRALRLIRKEAGAGGWADINRLMWIVVRSLPADLVEREPNSFGGRARLTDRGERIAAIVK